MSVTGYSGAPLLKKLGYREGQRACLVAVPVAELTAFAGFAQRRLLKDISALARETGPFDLIHLFAREAAPLAAALSQARERLVPDGMIWLSWPKKNAKEKAAKIATDLSDLVVRSHAIAAGLVDIKV